MKFEDISDYFWLRKTVRNPMAFVRFRKHFHPNEIFEIRFKDGRIFRLRGGTRDRHIFHRLYVRDEYRIQDIHQRDLDCVIDIGGHIGGFSFLVAPLARRVLTFEPVSENFDLLRRNLSGPQFNHVSCVKAAAIEGKKEVKIFISATSSGSHSAYPRKGADGTYEMVRGLSLEDIFREYDVERCDLLKLDCEGAEYGLLLSADEELLLRISRIVLEYHEVSGGDPRWNADALRERLEGNGFKVDMKSRKRHLTQGIMLCHR